MELLRTFRVQSVLSISKVSKFMDWNIWSSRGASKITWPSPTGRFLMGKTEASSASALCAKMNCKRRVTTAVEIVSQEILNNVWINKFCNLIPFAIWHSGGHLHNQCMLLCYSHSVEKDVEELGWIIGNSFRIQYLRNWLWNNLYTWKPRREAAHSC